MAHKVCVCGSAYAATARVVLHSCQPVVEETDTEIVQLETVFECWLDHPVHRQPY